jgi:organic radical activating enzyme
LIPYIKQCHFNVNINNIDRLVSNINNNFNCTVNYAIIGGEPLLHPDFKNIVLHLLSKTSLTKLEIYTNGSMYFTEKIPIDDRLKIMLSYHYGQINNKNLYINNINYIVNNNMNCKVSFLYDSTNKNELEKEKLYIDNEIKSAKLETVMSKIFPTKFYDVSDYKANTNKLPDYNTNLYVYNSIFVYYDMSWRYFCAIADWYRKKYHITNDIMDIYSINFLKDNLYKKQKCKNGCCDCCGADIVDES